MSPSIEAQLIPPATRAGSACLRTLNGDSLGRNNVLSLGNQETLFLQPADDLRSGRRCANSLSLLQALPQNLIVNKAPGILHRLDQSAFVVTRRWPGFLVLDFRIVQLRSLAVAYRWQQLRLVAFFVDGLPVRESCATRGGREIADEEIIDGKFRHRGHALVGDRLAWPLAPDDPRADLTQPASAYSGCGVYLMLLTNLIDLVMLRNDIDMRVERAA